MSSNRLLHFTSPGLKTQVINIAPEAIDDITKSKRYEIIDKEVKL